MKITSIKPSAIICFLLLITGSLTVHSQSMTDMNGNVYKTSKLGVQEWSASNLNVTKFRNGDVIPEAKTKEEWIKAGADEKPAWCYFKNDPANGFKYGKLYNWYAVNDKRGLAPNGWRIPVTADWMKFVKNLLGVDYAGPKLKSIQGWKSKNGVDKIGYKALPAGIRDEKGDFYFMGTVSHWWTNSEPVEVSKSNLIFSVKLNDNTTEVSYEKMKKENGLSVRCVRNLK